MQDFPGITQKLHRVQENIINLHSEMVGFFQKCNYPVLPQSDRNLLLEAIEYYKHLTIPPRFGVLVGEINHQLRSCFDHVIWHFSLNSIENINNVRQIEFPVFKERPTNHEGRSHFERKIQEITNLSVRSLIEELQPYNAASPLDDPLSIIHDFDIIDKHRELIFCVVTGSIVLPREMEGVLESYQRAHPELNAAQVARRFKNDGDTYPCISFRNFGARGVKSATEGLIELYKYTVSILDKFRNI